MQWVRADLFSHYSSAVYFLLAKSTRSYAYPHFLLLHQCPLPLSSPLLCFFWAFCRQEVMPYKKNRPGFICLNGLHSIPNIHFLYVERLRWWYMSEDMGTSCKCFFKISNKKKWTMLYSQCKFYIYIFKCVFVALHKTSWHIRKNKESLETICSSFRL